MVDSSSHQWSVFVRPRFLLQFRKNPPTKSIEKAAKSRKNIGQPKKKRVVTSVASADGRVKILSVVAEGQGLSLLRLHLDDNAEYTQIIGIPRIKPD